VSNNNGISIVLLGVPISIFAYNLWKIISVIMVEGDESLYLYLGNYANGIFSCELTLKNKENKDKIINGYFIKSIIFNKYNFKIIFSFKINFK
jgi:hypothetical protein